MLGSASHTDRDQHLVIACHSQHGGQQPGDRHCRLLAGWWLSRLQALSCVCNGKPERRRAWLCFQPGCRSWCLMHLLAHESDRPACA